MLDELEEELGLELKELELTERAAEDWTVCAAVVKIRPTFGSLLLVARKSSDDIYPQMFWILFFNHKRIWQGQIVESIRIKYLIYIV